MKNFDIAEKISRSLVEIFGGEFFRPSLKLKFSKDSFGNLLETELACIFSEKEKIILRSDDLSSQYIADEAYGSDSSAPSAGVDSISDITDFSSIVAFAESADGSPFCMDFRGNSNSPSIIWWDDDHWRKISDSAEDFSKLFLRLSCAS